VVVEGRLGRGRKLTLTWDALSGATAKHVSSVTTDRRSPRRRYTWNYAYTTDDRLTTCARRTSTACTVYTWRTRTQPVRQPTLNLNVLVIGGSTRTPASRPSSVLTNAGVDAGTYRKYARRAARAGRLRLDLGHFNGTSRTCSCRASWSRRLVPVAEHVVQDEHPPAACCSAYTAARSTRHTSANYPRRCTSTRTATCAAVLAERGRSDEVKSVVTDGAWHNVVLSGAGNTRRLRGRVATDPLAGTIALFQTTGARTEYLGAGFVGGGWPDLADTGRLARRGALLQGAISDRGASAPNR